MTKKNIINIECNLITKKDTFFFVEESLNHNKLVVREDVNAYKAYLYNKIPELKNVISESSFCNVDSRFIELYLKHIKKENIEAYPGVDFFFDCLYLANKKRLKVYLIGGHPKDSKKLEKIFSNKFGDIILSGVHHGYFDINDNSQVNKILDDIKEKAPAFVFIGMPSPMKEKFIFKLKDQLDGYTNLIAGVGGSFEILLGNHKRCPVIIRKIGFEWLYRIIQNPKKINIIIPLFIFFVNLVIWEIKKK